MFKMIDEFALGVIEGATDDDKENLLKERKELEKVLSLLGFLNAQNINPDIPLQDNLNLIDSDKVLCFDTECIENDGDYSNLFYSFLEHLNIDAESISVQSILTDDQKCKYTIQSNSKKWDFEWSQDSDYTTQEFYDASNQVLQEEFGFKFFILPATCQQIELLFLKSEHIDLLEEFIQKEADSDTETVGYFVMAYLTVGFVISLAIILTGWLVLNMLGTSILVAIAIMVYFLFKGSTRSSLVDRELA